MKAFSSLANGVSIWLARDVEVASSRRRKLLERHFRSIIAVHLCCLGAWCATLAISNVLFASWAVGRDLQVVPLLDGERDGLNNYWGGPFGTFNMGGIALETGIVHSGSAAYRADLGSLPPGALSFFQTFSSERSGTEAQRQTRDLSRYAGFEGHLRNDTNAPLNIRMEIKDYRDSNSHRASKTFTIPANSLWTRVSTSFDLSDGWSVVGNPDLERTYIASFVINEPQAISGSYYFDDFSLIEPGGPLDTATAPIESIVERLAERQFSGLWTGRNRTSGLIYNHKDDVGVAAMNVTGGTLWMLPAAVRRGWVSQTEADAFVSQVVDSLETNLDQSAYLPTRFIHPVTGARPGGANEESSIDASFIALALHNYKTQATTSAPLAAAIDAVQNRFQLDAFAISSGFRLAYFPGSGFTGGTYDGYTNEGKVISLAAELLDTHHVPLEELWNADTQRARTFLVNPEDSHMTHALSQFRAPFEQALLNLFVDTSDRGADNFPVRSLATNPWQNFVKYHREVSAKLEQLGRDHLFQPDAASGAPFSGYEQYSLYNDQGQPDLFMPWSVAFAMLAGAPGADDALRTLLDTDGVMGPLGLADSVRWNTGAPEPYFVSNSGDNWNTVLSTMAWMELLDRLEGQQSASREFAALSGVRAALDEVFLAGDFDGNGVVDTADYEFWRQNFGSSSLFAADANNDGTVNLADYTVWRDNLGAATATGSAEASLAAVPEAATQMLGLVALVGVGLARRVCRRLESFCVQPFSDEWNDG